MLHLAMLHWEQFTQYGNQFRGDLKTILQDQHSSTYFQYIIIYGFPTSFEKKLTRDDLYSVLGVYGGRGLGLLTASPCADAPSPGRSQRGDDTTPNFSRRSVFSSVPLYIAPGREQQKAHTEKP